MRVKANIPERLARELPAVEGVIGIGTVTDPYQGAERKFLLTRRCLEILKARDRTIHLHTKSDLVLRDVDVLSGMKGVVGITVTGTDDRVSKITEPGAPLPAARLEAIRGLVDAGIHCYALLAPVMSTLRGSEAALVDALAETGVRDVYYSSLHMRNYDSPRMERLGITDSPQSEIAIRDRCREIGLNVRDVFRS